MTDLLLGIIVVFLLVVITLLVVLFQRSKKKESGGEILLIQNQMNEMARTLDARLGDLHRSNQSQFGESAKIIRDVTEKLTALGETNKQIVSFSAQLQSLQDVLQNPKRRGVLGEYYLETVLKNVLPPAAYKMQYRVGREDAGLDLIVDAAIFVDKDIIPVDSKFSLENYNRLIEVKDPIEKERLEKLFKQDLKNRIDETSKYIRPADGTVDFAFMFIPSEAIYYDLLINTVGAVKVNTEDLMQYALKKRVIVVSPNSFYAFLQTVLHGLRQMEIEKSAREIAKRVEELGRHMKAYEDYHAKLGKSLGVTVSHFNSSNKELMKIDKDVYRITGERGGIEPLMIDKPAEE